MTETQKTALSYLRDFINPHITTAAPADGKPVFKTHTQQVASKLDSAKEVLAAHMERNGTGGIAAATQIMKEGHIRGAEAGYLLAAGAWHDLPALLMGASMQSHATKLRQFRRTRTVEADGFSFEWTALTALIGFPPPPAKR
jgi:hypothetical protein